MTREQATRLSRKLLDILDGHLSIYPVTKGYLIEVFTETIHQFEAKRTFAGLPIETVQASEEPTLEEVLGPLTWRECAKLLYLRTQVQGEAIEILKAQVKSLSQGPNGQANRSDNRPTRADRNHRDNSTEAQT